MKFNILNTSSIARPFHYLGKLILIAVMLSISWQVQASCTFFDGFKDNNDGTVTDPRNGLIWKRCAEGFEWNGSKCLGSEKKLNWFEAMQTAKQSRFLGKTDWRIPSKAEFEAVVVKHDDCENKKYESGQYAASSSIAHAFNTKGHSGYFWSSSPHAGDESDAWVVGFDDGYVNGNDRNNGNHVRLVRASQSLGDKVALEFNTEYAKVVPYIKERSAMEAQQEKEKQAAAARQAKEQAREDERRAKADRERIAAGCDRFYAGKAIGYKPPGFVYFGNALDAVVLGKGGGNISIKLVDGDYPDTYGKTLEVSCTSDRLQ